VLTLLPIAFVSISAAAQAKAGQETRIEPQGTAEPDLINPDRPGIADGSNVIGGGRLQAETGIQQEFRREGQDREHTLFLPTLLRFGISSRWEARVESNTFTRTLTLAPANPASPASGLGPVSFGFKYHIQDSKGVRHPSLGTIVRVFPASGSGDFHSNHVVADFRLAADWDFAPKFSLNPNLGVVRGEDDQGKTFPALLSAVTLSYAPTRKFSPFIDIGLQAPEVKKGETALIFDAGLAYIVGHNVQLDASVGNGVHGTTPPRPFLSAGFSIRSSPWGHQK